MSLNYIYETAAAVRIVPLFKPAILLRNNDRYCDGKLTCGIIDLNPPLLYIVKAYRYEKK